MTQVKTQFILFLKTDTNKTFLKKNSDNGQMKRCVINLTVESTCKITHYKILLPVVS